MNTPESIIQSLGLLPHPEGGFYKETYRSADSFQRTGADAFPSGRSYATAIVFLLTAGNFSAFHRIRSDETWHFYDGDPTVVVEISTDGKLVKTVIGPYISKGQVFQYTVKAGNWFASAVHEGGKYSLTGCTVSPGFDFRDFEMAKKAVLAAEFPVHQDVIRMFTRE